MRLRSKTVGKDEELDEFPIEVVKNLKQTGIAWMTAVLQDI